MNKNNKQDLFSKLVFIMILSFGIFLLVMGFLISDELRDRNYNEEIHTCTMTCQERVELGMTIIGTSYPVFDMNCIPDRQFCPDCCLYWIYNESKR